VSGNTILTVAADESTLCRWRSWFKERVHHLAGWLASIHIRYQKAFAEDSSRLCQSVLLRIWQYVGDAPGWLARTVRPVVNSNNWVQTRSAFLS